MVILPIVAKAVILHKGESTPYRSASPRSYSISYSIKAEYAYFCMRAGRCRRPKIDAAANASAGRKGIQEKGSLLDSDDKKGRLLLQ